MGFVNVYKRTLLLSAMALGLVACSREELPYVGDNDGQVLEQGLTMTINASISSPESTKTSLSGNDADGYKVLWSEGDQIIIGGETFTLDGGAGTTRGTFTGNLLKDGTYDAYYGTSDGKIPMTQTYEAGKITNSPMHAQITVTDGKAGAATFKNVGGLLHITVKNVQKAKVNSIMVLGNASTSSISLSLDCGEYGVELAENGTDFYIAMPENRYSGVEITIAATLIDINNVTRSAEITKKLGNGKTLGIARSQITDASFTVSFEGKFPTYHNGHEYVDLGLPSGLKWATCNVGAERVTDAGYYFAWGEISPKENYTFEAYTYQGSAAVLPMENDAATAAWGGEWRLPTKEDFEELKRMDNVFLNPGCKFSGSNGNSIFLPFTGHMSGTTLINADTDGYYLTSTSDGGYPDMLRLYRPSQGALYIIEMGSFYPFEGYAVRPVFK